MSIYPVKLSEWFPVEDEMYFYSSIAVKYTRCLACGKRCKYSKAYGHHSLPWGYGDIWCSFKCLNSGKVYKLDKRQRRKLNRKFKDCILNDIKVSL